MLNETSPFDGEWMLDFEHDVSSKGCVLVPSVETCPVEYDVIKIQGNEIYFGDFTAEQKEDIKKFSQGDTESFRRILMEYVALKTDLVS